MKKLTILLVLVALLFSAAALAEGDLRLMEAKQVAGTQDIRLYISTDTVPTQDNLAVYMDGEKQELPLQIQSASEAQVGVVYVFCLDVSGTISAADIQTAREQLVDFAGQLGANDLMRVYVIGDEAKPLTGYTRSQEQVAEALDSMNVRTQNTYLWASVRMAADDLIANRDSLPRLAQIIVYTDGVDDSHGTGSVQEALSSVQSAGMPLRVVLMNSSQTNASTQDITWLCGESGGVLIDGRENFKASLGDLEEVIGNDYCVTGSGLSYDKLQGTSQWHLEQTTDRGVSVSNTMRAELTQEGLPQPVRGIQMTIDGEPAGDQTVTVAQDTDVTVAWQADGEVKSYTLNFYRGDELISSEPVARASATYNSGSLSLDDVYRVEVEAVPASADRDQALTAQVRFAVEQRPVASLTLTVNGTLAGGGAVAVEQDAEVALSWAADGDVRGYTVTLAEDGQSIETGPAEGNTYTCSSAGWALDKTYTFTVKADPYSQAEGQATEVTAAMVLKPRDVTALNLQVDGAERTDDGVFLVEQDTSATVSWQADGDVKQYSVTAAGQTAATEGASWSFDTVGLELGQLYTVSVEAQTWSDAQDQATSASVLVALKPKAIASFSLTADGQEVGDGVIVVEQGQNLHLNWTLEGDVRQVRVTAPEGIQVTQTENGCEVSGEGVGMGEVCEVKVVAEPYAYGEVGEDVSLTRSAKFSMKPIPVAGMHLYVDGQETGGDVLPVQQDQEPTLSWAADGDVKQYTVKLYRGETLLGSTDTPAESQPLPVAAMELGQEYAIEVTADPWSGEAGQALAGRVRFALVPVPVTEMTMQVNGRAADGALSVEQGSQAGISWTVNGDVKGYAVRLYEDGTLIREKDTDGTTYILSGADMTLGKAYRVQVEAEPWSDAEGQTLTAEAGFTLKPKPITAVRMNGEGTLGVAQGESAQIQWSASGDAKGHTLRVFEDTALVKEAYTANTSYSLSSEDMALGKTYKVQVEADPWSDAQGQNLRAEAAYTLIPKPITSVRMDAEGVQGVEQGSQANLTWTVEGDARGYTVRVFEGSVTLKKLYTETAAYALPGADMELGKTYTVQVEADPWSDAEGQNLTAEATCTLIPRPITALTVNGGESSGVEQDGQAYTEWTCEGDAKGYTVRVYEDDQQIVQQYITDKNYTLSGADMALGKTYRVQVEADPWSNAEGQVLTGEASYTLIPRPVTGITMGAADTVGVAQGSSAEVTWTAEGDVRGYAVRVYEDGELIKEETVDGAPYALESADMALGKTYTVEVEADPWSDAEDQSLTGEATYVLEPRQVTALSLTAGGQPAGDESIVIVVEEDTVLQWEADGDVKEYVVHLPGEETSTIEGSQYTVALSSLSPETPSEYTVEAVPLAEDQEETVSASVRLLRTYAALTGMGFTLDGEPYTGEETLILDETAKTLAVTAEGDLKEVRFRVTDGKGETAELAPLEDGRSVELTRDTLARKGEYTLTAELVPLDGGAAAETLSMQVKKADTLNIPLIAGIAGGALLLLILLLALLLHRRKVNKAKKAAAETPEKPGPTPAPVQPPVGHGTSTVVCTVTYTQEVQGEPPANMKHVVRNRALIGRDPESDIYFNNGELWERTVSRRQAELLLDDEGNLYIMNKSETSPTLVDGQPVKGRVRLVSGTVVDMGEVHWTIRKIDKAYK